MSFFLWFLIFWLIGTLLGTVAAVDGLRTICDSSERVRRIKRQFAEENPDCSEKDIDKLIEGLYEGSFEIYATCFCKSLIKWPFAIIGWTILQINLFILWLQGW